MQHNPRSALGSRWVSRNRAAPGEWDNNNTMTAELGARARGGGSDTAVAAICGTAQIGGSSGVAGRVDEVGCFQQRCTNTNEDDWLRWLWCTVMQSETFDRATGFDDTAHKHLSTLRWCRHHDLNACDGPWSCGVHHLLSVFKKTSVSHSRWARCSGRRATSWQRHRCWGAVKFGPPGSGSGSRGRAAATVDGGNRAPAAKAQQVQGTAQLQLQKRCKSLPTNSAAATKRTPTLAAEVEHTLSTSSWTWEDSFFLEREGMNKVSEKRERECLVNSRQEPPQPSRRSSQMTSQVEALCSRPPRRSSNDNANAWAAQHASAVHHLRNHARRAAWRISRGSQRALALASRLRKSWASSDHLPPVSQASTTRRARPWSPEISGCPSSEGGLVP